MSKASVQLSYLYLGGDSLDTTADAIFSEINEVAGGDVNDDGYSDIVIGNAGVYLGGVPIDTTLDVDFGIISGNVGVGYFNRDSYADVIVGDDDSYGGLGSVLIFLGGDPMDDEYDWGGMGTGGGNLGYSVSSAGDVNGDGVDDIIIGEPGYYFHSNRGRVFVLSGDTTTTGVEEEEREESPEECVLYQNYPNPFNTTTSIQYSLTGGERRRENGERTTHPHISLKIFNVLGKEVRTLVDEVMEPGVYTATWDGCDESGKEVGSGVYLYRLEVGSIIEAKKLTLLK